MMSNTFLAHIAEKTLNRPLMIMPDKLAVISGILEGRIGIEAVKPEGNVPVPDASRFIGTVEKDANGNTKPYRTTTDGTAIIPVIGSLVGRGGWLDALSGVQSYERLKFSLAAAAKDDAVSAIVLDIDSPGGEAVGAFETADAVRAAAASKPVYAVATGLCCSAAYAIASAATSIITTKSSVLGSIGVVMLHADYSHALHERGVVPTLIHAGKKKVDGSPYKPLTDEVKASLKAEIEKFNSLFVATVAEGRPKLTPAAILGMEAGTFVGADAVKAGLADRVGSIEAVLAELAAKAPPRPSPSSTRPSGNGVLLASPQAAPSATSGARSAEDRAELERAAGGDQRLTSVVAAFANSPVSQVLQADALSVIRSVKQTLAEQDANASLHHSGLFLPNLQVPGGPLFRPEPTASDHGWGDVIANINKDRRRH